MAYTATNLGLLSGGSSSGALGCSHDGSIVVGFAVDSGGQQQAVYWDAGGIIHTLPGTTGPGSSAAVACSSDGTVIVGNLNGAGAVTWSGASYATVTNLPALGMGFFAQAFGCSSDASIVVGQSDGSMLGSPETAVVWTNGAIVALPFESGGDNAAASACNAAGTILSGNSNDGSGNFRAVKWTGGPGWALTTLNSLSGSPNDQVNASNSSSSVLAGSILTGSNIDACTWAGLTPSVLAGPIGGSGSTVLGSDGTGNTLCGVSAANVAAVWVSGVGAALTTFAGAVSVDQASAVSSDASTIVGFGTDASHRQTAVKWTGGAPSGPPLVWFRLNTGAWFPSGDPATVTGGISLAPLSGDPLFATVQGTGDAGMTLNAGATPFVGSVPAGYTGGLPHSGGGFTTLDPTKLHGSAGLNNSNHTASFITSPGVAQSVDGYTSGQYYFELTNPTGDIFSAFWGGGVGRNFNSGGDYNSWFNLGGFTSGDNNGGAIVSNETLGQPLATIGALNQVVTANAFAFPINNGDVIGVALFISSSPPPPPTPTPAVVIPVGLGRWRGQCGINWNGLALVGDAFSNVVGLSDFSNFNEYGNQIQMLATAPPIHDDRKRIFISRFELEVEAGLGLPNAPQTAPQLTLDYSKNGGITFVPLQVFRSMGAAGEYVKRLRWINIGQSRTWVFRIRYSDPARPTIIGTYYDAWKGLG